MGVNINNYYDMNKNTFECLKLYLGDNLRVISLKSKSKKSVGQNLTDVFLDTASRELYEDEYINKWFDMSMLKYYKHAGMTAVKFGEVKSIWLGK